MDLSDSGKTTLLNMLGLLDRPDSGSYQFAYAETALLSEVERAELRSQHTGFVFQAYHLIPRLSARENVEIPMLLAGVKPLNAANLPARC